MENIQRYRMKKVRLGKLEGLTHTELEGYGDESDTYLEGNVVIGTTLKDGRVVGVREDGTYDYQGEYVGLGITHPNVELHIGINSWEDIERKYNFKTITIDEYVEYDELGITIPDGNYRVTMTGSFAITVENGVERSNPELHSKICYEFFKLQERKRNEQSK